MIVLKTIVAVLIYSQTGGVKNMAEPPKQKIGDGQDNYGRAAGQAVKAAREVSKAAAKQAAVKGTEATANAAAATVQGGVKVGKAVANLAAGSATGGPWGAILSAAWAMRHTLFKVFICICLVIVFLVVLLCSLPSIIFSYLFGLGGSSPDTGSAIEFSYAELSEDVSAVIDSGYEQALDRVEEIIRNGGYDYDLSMEALVDNAQSNAGYDVAYILAAYSASLEQKDTSVEDMVAKLNQVSGEMFPVSYVEKQQDRSVPVAYQTYKQVTVTVVTETESAGIVNGVPLYNYVTEQRTYYLPDQTMESDVSVTVAKYKSVNVTVPTYSNGEISGTQTATYYEADGSETVQPTTEIIKYVACTISSFDNSVIEDAFDLDLTAQYSQFNTTYGDAIENMALSLKKTLYGSLSSGEAVPLTDAELLAFVAQQNCTPVREHILTTGLSLVGRVPYFWGGKSPPGWNDEWNTPKLVTSAGSSSTGTIRPYGLDCSGFSDWVYKTAVGISLYGDNWSQWDNSYEISSSELLPGDLGFLMNDDGSGWNHVLIFAGYGSEGQRMWVHCTSGKGVVLNTPSYESRLRLRRPKYVDFDAPFI